MKTTTGGRRQQSRPVPPSAPPPGAAAERGCQHTLTIATVPANVPLARRTARTAFTGWGIPPTSSVVEAALLIVTELVANTVRHAADRSPHADLTLAICDGHLEITVHDDHPRVPPLPPPPPAAGAPPDMVCD